jgi:hypothetical protein
MQHEFVNSKNELCRYLLRNFKTSYKFNLFNKTVTKDEEFTIMKTKKKPLLPVPRLWFAQVHGKGKEFSLLKKQK